MVGETTCDGKKKMYEYMGEFKDVFIMELPNTQSIEALRLWKSELERLKEYIEEKFGKKITDEELRDSVRLTNEFRKAQKELMSLMAYDPVPVSGYDMFKVLYGAGFKFDKNEAVSEIRAVAKRIEDEYGEGKMQPRAKRILITGCPIGGATEKVIRAVEDNGGVVVAFENCSGAKQYDRLIDENAEDILGAIAERYLEIGCSVMTPNENRYDLLGRMLDEFKVDGVVEMTLTACHTYNLESRGIKRFVNNKGVPYICVETDYSSSDIGQLNTRIAAFIEML